MFFDKHDNSHNLGAVFIHPKQILLVGSHSRRTIRHLDAAGSYRENRWIDSTRCDGDLSVSNMYSAHERQREIQGVP